MRLSKHRGKMVNIACAVNKETLTREIVENFFCSAQFCRHNKSFATSNCLFSGYNFVEMFAGAIGVLDEYAILIQVRSTLSISFKLEQSWLAGKRGMRSAECGK